MSARSQVWEAGVARAREFEKWDAEHCEDAYYNRNDWRDRTVLKHLSAEFAAVRAEERKSIVEWMRGYAAGYEISGEPHSATDLADCIERGDHHG